MPYTDSVLNYMKSLPIDDNDEQFVNSTVDTYLEDRTNSSRDKILKLFDKYFLKYAALLCNHTAVSFSNKDTLTFLRLFMTDEERMSIATANKAAAKYIYMLRKIFSDYTSVDMYNQMMIFFLEVLLKYKPMLTTSKTIKERISFTHYAMVNMRYKIKKLAQAKSRDALSGQSYIQFNDLQDVPQDPGKFAQDHSPIDLKWVYGATTGDVFLQLTEAERYLIWLKYESNKEGKKKTDEQIAKLTGLHFKTVVYRLKKIKEKLQELI